jgi:hypothetical protein
MEAAAPFPTSVGSPASSQDEAKENIVESIRNMVDSSSADEDLLKVSYSKMIGGNPQSQTDSATTNSVAFFGRSFEEYLPMFAVETTMLNHKAILDCPGGPSSFNATGTNSFGLNIISCDPRYDQSPQDLRKVSLQNLGAVTESIGKFPTGFFNIGSIEKFEQARRGQIQCFLDDFENDRELLSQLGDSRYRARYVPACLPNLPFADKVFDIVLVGNFLFAYAPKIDGGILDCPIDAAVSPLTTPSTTPATTPCSSQETSGQASSAAVSNKAAAGSCSVSASSQSSGSAKSTAAATCRTTSATLSTPPLMSPTGPSSTSKTDLNFHLAAIKELTRVCKHELRIVPIRAMELNLRPHPYLQKVKEYLGELGFSVQIVRSEYEDFFKMPSDVLVATRNG